MSKKTKILMVAPRSPLVGGQAIQAQRLLDKFNEENSVTVDIQAINPRFFPRLQKLRFLRTILTSVKYIFDLIIKIPRYDVIHIFSASYFSFILAPTPAIIIAKIFGKKTILNYRSGEAEDHLRRWKSALRTMQLVDKIITPSGYLVDVFSKFGLKAESVFNFVEGDKFKYRERKDFAPIFLSNRNFEPLYNVGCALRAFRHVQDRFSDARLIIAGDGPQRASLESLANDLKLENCEFVGRISQSEMRDLYDQVDIYINSPNIDNMPNSIIEAFASGVPVVSTNAGGIPYIVENEKTGLLVNVGDCKELGSAAIRLLEDEAFARIVAKNAFQEAKKYSWASVREKWLKVYTES